MAGPTERERHRRSRPADDGLRRLATALGGREARVVRRLGGGLGSATHLVEIDGGRRVVLKRYPEGSDLPGLEWVCLEHAFGARLPAPEPIALDQVGAWFGTPSLAIGVVPGRPLLAPTDIDRYVDDVAIAIAHVHETSSPTSDGPLRRPAPPHGWDAPDEVPDGLLGPALAERVVHAVAQHLPGADQGGPPVFAHGDFHPGNLLWRRGRLSGIVDWSHARFGPRWWELAYFRMELAVLVDDVAARDLLRRYEAEAGRASADQPVWDLLCLYNGHRWGHFWLAGYREQGRRDLTLDAMRGPLERLARRALADVGG